MDPNATNQTVDQISTEISGHKFTKVKWPEKPQKPNVTRKINEITELVKDVNNLEHVQRVYYDFEESLKKFTLAHGNYHANLTDEDDVQESEAYYSVEVRRTSAFKDTIKTWLENNEFCHKNRTEQFNEIRPSDSMSNIGSRTDCGSKSSRKSKVIRSDIGSLSSRVSSKGSAFSAKAAAAAARKAVLEEEAIRLQRRQELQQQELCLKQRREELETKIAQAAAEERTYSEIGATQPEHVNPKQCHDELHVCSIVNSKVMGRPREEHSRINLEAVNQLPTTQNLPSTPLNPHAKNGSVNRNKVSRCQTSLTDRNRPDTLTNEQLNTIGNEDNLAVLQSVYPSQETHTQDAKIVELLIQQQQQTLALTLPSPKVPIFHGNPIDFHTFIQAFEQFIESKTQNDSSRLYYLLQYTSGDVQDLMRSCLSMSPEEEYKEARRLLKTKYGRNYQIATAYVERVINYPSIKSEDGESLQWFSIMLTTCKNALKQIGYLSKIENPDSLQKIMEKLPFGLRQKWCDVADDITEVKQREITIEDIALFVEKRARACNHPIFGKI